MLALVGIIYKTNEKKLEKLDEKIEHEVRCARLELKSKADAEDVKKALGHIETLFEKAEIDRERTHAEFAKINQRMTDTHIVLLNKIAELPDICQKK